MKTRNEADKQAELAIITKEIRQMIETTSRLFKDTKVSFDQAQTIAGWIVEMRRSLSEWSDQESKYLPVDATSEDIRVLSKRLVELEGLVKEVRNGLECKQHQAHLKEEKSG